VATPNNTEGGETGEPVSKKKKEKKKKGIIF